MTEKKELGKIKSAKFGKVNDRPYIFGLQLEFGGDSWGVGDGGIYCFNIESPRLIEQAPAVVQNASAIYSILNQAKVNTVDQLVGKPVEVTFDGTMFRSFRILTEVL